MNNRAFTEREMWVAIRGYLLGMITAIDAARGSQTPMVMAMRAGLLGIAKAIELHYQIKPKRDLN